MPYLIDGYNLLHAMGVLRGSTGPNGLLKARLRLLGLLHAVYGDAAGAVTVVFDAAQAPPGASAEEDFRGVRVRFAVHEREADDLIESLIQHDSAPRRLTVVSDDHRIQQAARRRRCHAVGCQDYLTTLEQLHRVRRPPAPNDGPKSGSVSADETNYWLNEFAGLGDDPEARELFDPFGFGEEMR